MSADESIWMLPVVEAPYFEGEFLAPWSVPEFEPLSMIQLHEGMSHPEVGLVMAQLAAYNHIDLENDRQTVLEQILGADSLVLPGGIEVISQGKVIPPSCCCGLETWREWQEFLKTGNSPWLGHDPSPWLESDGDIVRIWSDGGLEAVKDAFYFNVSRSDFAVYLMLLEEELRGFLIAVEDWARFVDFPKHDQLFWKLDQCFDVGIRKRPFGVYSLLKWS
ncbi:MAG: hypothetical protein F6J87_31565 [Spirulina sp. SIO3F2]|nr:hypothetical protein [Spirulina sp. SIO3F2]